MCLIASLMEGDHVAFKMIYNSTFERTFYFLLKRTNCREEALDLAQNTYLNLWKYRETLNPDYTVNQQVFFIARRMYIDYLRKENSRANLEAPDHTGEINDNLDNVVSNDMKETLAPFLNRMPRIRQRIFTLHKYDGFSYKEIANMFYIKEKAVEYHIAQAIRLIRKGLLLVVFYLFF